MFLGNVVCGKNKNIPITKLHLDKGIVKNKHSTKTQVKP